MIREPLPAFPRRFEIANKSWRVNRRPSVRVILRWRFDGHAHARERAEKALGADRQVLGVSIFPARMNC